MDIKELAQEDCRESFEDFRLTDEDASDALADLQLGWGKSQLSGMHGRDDSDGFDVASVDGYSWE